MFMPKKKKINSIAILSGLVMAALLPATAFGYPHGSIIPETGTYTFEANMTLELLDNTAGAETKFQFNEGDGPHYNIYCNTRIDAWRNASDPEYGVTYNFESTMPQSSVNPGYLYLNEYFDVKVELRVGGYFNGEATVPQRDLWNRGSGPMECNPTFTNSTLYQLKLDTGSKGTITFKLKKPIINGIIINQEELVQVFAKTGRPTLAGTGYAGIPSTRVILAAGIVTVKDSCEINGGKPINVDFDAIPNTSEQLNGANYVRPFIIPIKCTGGSFDSGDLNIKLSLLPGPSGSADFNTDYFGTLKSGVKRTNLGIKITETNSGSVVRPNQAYVVPNFVNNQGEWRLSAAPIAAPGSTVDDGEFTATGTILAEFQ